MKKLLPDYLEFSINCLLGKQQINALSRQIIGQANINTYELRSLRVPLPPLDYQQKLVDIVQDGRERIDDEKEKMQLVETETEQVIELLALGLRDNVRADEVSTKTALALA